MDPESLAGGEEFDNESQFVRWAVDPGGRTFRVEAEVPAPFEGPMFRPHGDEGPVLRFVLWRVNRIIRRGLERGERRHQGPPDCFLEVWEEGGDGGEQLVCEETCCGMEEGRVRGAVLVSAIRAGTFASN